MATEIKMPQLSDTMSSGKIISWKKNEGDTVKRGEILAEVETDKANLEIECFHPGVLLKIVVPAGSVGKVGEAIAIVGQAGESVGATSSKPFPHAAEASQPASSQPAPPQAKTPEIQVTKQAPANNQQQLHVVSNPERVKASPLAKKVAEQLQVNLTGVTGSGPQGRIVKKDVELAAGGATPPAQQGNIAMRQQEESRYSPAPASVSAAGTLTPFTKMRETIARRMQESVVTAPHFYVSTSIIMDEAFKLREILKEEDSYKGISVNHLVIKACGYALSKEPRVNSAVRDGQTYQPAQINIGIITVVGDGLLIPVVKEVDKLTLKDVVFEARAAVDRARAGRPSSSDLSGGTFSISNMGMFDVDSFTAIINPGQGGILAVSATKEAPVVQNGAIKVAKVMNVTVSVDHRIIDGVMASTFLKHFKTALETPALLAL